MGTTLFDNFDRSDASPQAASEGNFAFLNRAATPFFAEVRRLHDVWFTRYPKGEAPQLRETFRSPLPGQHWAAWWELYSHEFESHRPEDDERDLEALESFAPTSG